MYDWDGDYEYEAIAIMDTASGELLKIIYAEDENLSKFSAMTFDPSES